VKALLAAVTLTLLFRSPCAPAQASVLFSFDNNDGSEPIGGVVFDSSGNLYGTTFYGGSSTVGVAYQLKPSSGGGWTEKVLHTFTTSGTDRYWTPAGLTLDSAGNLYGVTWFGGTAHDGMASYTSSRPTATVSGARPSCTTSSRTASTACGTTAATD
jgi:uncharacterized repeat protein (TIGR03803 family)